MFVYLRNIIATNKINIGLTKTNKENFNCYP